MITFHDLYERYSDHVYRYSYWLSGSKEDADDITSETFVRMWISRKEIRVETVKMGGTVVAFVAADQRRQRRAVESACS